MRLLQIFVMAFLSAEEGHTPSGDLQGKKSLLKIIKVTKRKCYIPLFYSPENIHSKQKSHPMHADREFQNKTDAKRIRSFGLIE